MAQITNVEFTRKGYFDRGVLYITLDNGLTFVVDATYAFADDVPKDPPSNTGSGVQR